MPDARYSKAPCFSCCLTLSGKSIGGSPALANICLVTTCCCKRPNEMGRQEKTPDIYIDHDIQPHSPITLLQQEARYVWRLELWRHDHANNPHHSCQPVIPATTVVPQQLQLAQRLHRLHQLLQSNHSCCSYSRQANNPPTAFFLPLGSLPSPLVADAS